MDEEKAYGIVDELCRRCEMDIVAEAEREMFDQGLGRAVERHDSKALFNWIMYPASYQGVSDRIAESFHEQYGNVTYLQISRALNTKPRCGKLAGFEEFQGCGFVKGNETCNNPVMYSRCPLPRHPLRNGRLNIMAYSLYFFIRDVCDNDLVSFIDQIANQDKPARDRLDELVRDLSRIYGMQGKIIHMVFSSFLLGLGPIKPAWKELGYVAIAIDTLVHNFLHRTGLLLFYGMEHKFSSCYGPRGCRAVLEDLASKIDCSRFSDNNPAYFPRFVQLAVWLFCSEGGENICNGRMIDDNAPCENSDCPLYDLCDRIPLYEGGGA
jgi:hypothetical protein